MIHSFVFAHAHRIRGWPVVRPRLTNTSRTTRILAIALSPANDHAMQRGSADAEDGLCLAEGHARVQGPQRRLFHGHAGGSPRALAGPSYDSAPARSCNINVQNYATKNYLLQRMTQVERGRWTLANGAVEGNSFSKVHRGKIFAGLTRFNENFDLSNQNMSHSYEKKKICYLVFS